MGVSLYTSRVILRTLGVEDFGIYNVVGGVVAMFSLISGSLSAAIGRYITFELGRKNVERLKTIFSSAVTIQFILALGICVLAEIIGVWFLNNKMNIPVERKEAANWVFQCSILTFMINLVSIPYNAVIIAHEHMKSFAYISILEVILKLFIVLALSITIFDRLKFYAILMLIVAVIMCFVYYYYCKHNFKECTYSLVYDKILLKEMMSFAGWNFIGSGSFILMTQGVNILINLFFGVTVNAARGIAAQVDGVVNQFVTNFMTALNPQIIKSYASKDKEYMLFLVCKGSKYSYFLMLFFALPIFIEANTVLILWLKVVPEYTVLFLRLTILISLLSVISNTLVTSVLATGYIKKYQIIVGGLGMLVFPFAYFSYKLGFSPEVAYFIQFFIFIIQLAVRLFLLSNLIGLRISRFVKEVLMKIVFVTVAAMFVPAVIYCVLPPSFSRFLLILILGNIISILSIYIFGLERNERTLLRDKSNLFFQKVIDRVKFLFVKY